MYGLRLQKITVMPICLKILEPLITLSTMACNASMFVVHVFKPPPLVGAGGGYMFSGRPSVHPSVHPCVPDSRGSFMFPRYLQYLLTDFRQTFVTGASRDRPDYVFGSKGQSSRSRHRDGGAQHSTLPLSATFFCCTGKLFD